MRSRSWLLHPKTGDWYPRFRQLLWIGDTIAISIAVFATFNALFSPGDDLGALQGFHYAWFAPILIGLWLLGLESTVSRARRIVGSGLDEYRLVLSASLYVFGGLAILSFWLKAELSRALFVTALPFGVVLLLAFRWLARQRLHTLRKRGLALTPALVAGNIDSIVDVVSDLERNSLGGFLAAGVCIFGPVDPTTAAGVAALPAIRATELSAAVSSGRYGAVIIGDGLSREEVRELAWRLENQPIELMMVPRLADASGPRMKMRSAENLHLMHVELPAFTGWKLTIKRAFDVAFSVLALILLAPALVVVAALIKLDDRGPVLFRQERIGRNGVPFTIHKFRTMSVDAEARIGELIAANGGTALLFKLEEDPRITRIGKWLRRYSIDELPQFWTVLRGPMSIVGPRPQVAREVAEYSDRHHRRLLIKPGITGLWQVNGRSALSPDESIRLDLRYVENWSLTGDLVLVARTVRAALSGGGAL